MLNNTEYIYGVHCGNKDCYACATQRYNCKELERLDDLDDVDKGEKGVRLSSISIRSN
tara:strand:- start:377 stop:550 length:174 start_codon:yes stop_codon:yes gene_type:complete